MGPILRKAQIIFVIWILGTKCKNAKMIQTSHDIESHLRKFRWSKEH
jgi:hypothetical protein